MEIKTLIKLSLVLDLDDTVISVKREGSHNLVEYYSWTVFSATEGIDPDWKSEIIPLDNLITRLDSFSSELTVENQHVIDTFFKTVKA